MGKKWSCGVAHFPIDPISTRMVLIIIFYTNQKKFHKNFKSKKNSSKKYLSVDFGSFHSEEINLSK